MIARADIYYGVLAAQALQGLPTTDAAMLRNISQVVGPPSRIAGDDGSQAFAEQWLQQWDAFAGVSDPATLAEAVAADQDLRTGRLLLQVDDRTNATDALDRLYERYKDDPQTLYALALEFAAHRRLSPQHYQHVAPAPIQPRGPGGECADLPAELCLPALF
ncbi:MAG: hypothetical protein V9G23_02935 [Giesbergeria sp.]